VDVNVSPHKTEVRFADADDIYQIVSAAVRGTLAKSGNVGAMEFERAAVEIPVMSDDAVVYAEPKVSDNADYNPFREDYVSDAGAGEDNVVEDFSSVMMRPSRVASVSPRVPKAESYSEMGGTRLQDVVWGGGGFDLDAEPESEVDFPEPTPVVTPLAGGIDLSALVDEQESELVFSKSVAMQQQLGVEQSLSFQDVMPISGGVVIAVSDGRSYVVDMRRVKERLLYDGYMAMLKSGSCPSQRLLFAEELILSEDDFSLLQEHEVEIAALGFDMELKEDGKVVLGGIPANVAAEEADGLLYELLRVVEANCDACAHVKEKMACVMAAKCSRQITKLTREQSQEMLGRLCECENYSFSPSGKAIMAELTIDELRSKLK
jgi:DNA mismatch repair protein MutL